MKKLQYHLCFGISLLFLLASCAQPASQVETANHWQEQYDLGMRYLAEGNYSEAIVAFTLAIEIDPKQAPAYVGRGDAYAGFVGTKQGESQARDNLEKAADDYGEAIELNPENADYYIKRGDAYVLLSELVDNWLDYLQTAIEDFSAAIGLNPSLAEAYMKRAKAYARLGETEENLAAARSDYEKTRELNGTDEQNDFSARKYYVPFELLSRKVQSDIRLMLSSLKNENRDDVWRTLAPYTSREVDETIYTECDNYRILFYTYASPVGSSCIEARPENGRGYLCLYNETKQEFGNGECVSWNWNGSFDHYEHNGASNEYDLNISGSMAEGMYDGSIHYIELRPGREGLHRSEWDEVFSNGKLISISEFGPVVNDNYYSRSFGHFNKAFLSDDASRPELDWSDG